VRQSPIFIYGFAMFSRQIQIEMTGLGDIIVWSSAAGNEFTHRRRQ
jgi:hypothetical protein